MKKRLIPAAIILVVSMFVLAEYTGEQEIIFPEIAALALGGWVMEISPWVGNWLHFWLSPTLAALTGIVIIKAFPYSPLIMISGAFILVLIQLRLTGSGVFPSLSAAILPIITHVNSFVYPLSVCVLTFIIALGKKVIDDYTKKNVSDSILAISSEQEKNDEISQELINWGKQLTGVVLVSAVALKSHWIYMVAPPLIVAFVELAKPQGSLQKKSGLVFTLLTLAAFLGVFWLFLIHYFLHWPVWISSALAMVSLFFLFNIFRLPFPPAAAISLLPTIIPVKSLWIYPGQVLSGSLCFIIISLVLRKKSTLNNRTNYNKSQ